MRTLIWNVTAETQTLPEIYDSTEVATRWGYVVADSLSDAIANLGGFSGMNNKWAILPISPDEELGNKQVFGGGFAVALGSDGNIPWGNIVGKPVWKAVAFSGQYGDLLGKPTLSAVATSGQYGDLAGRPVTAAPSNATPNGVDATSSSAGSSADASRADHKHAHGSLPGGALHADATSTSSGFMAATQVSKLAGISDNAAAVSSATPQAIGTANAGISVEASKADHVHAHGDQAGGSLHSVASGSAAGFMSSADKTKLDGVAANAAALTATAPSAVGAAASVGAASTAAKADHVHAHGDQAGGSLHANATATVAGFMSAADKTKLDSINRVYDLMGSSQDALTPGTIIAEAVVPRAISFTAFTQTNTAGRATVKLQIGGTDITTFPAAAASGQVVRVVVSAAGTAISWTLAGKEA